MNLPNKLTMLRILLIPLFLLLMLVNFPHHFLVAFVVFAVASATDALDGNIARKRGLVTDFGKFMDPLADKLLTMSAFICFIEIGIVPAVMIFIIVARELAVTGLRTLAADKGVVIAADKFGKIKTVLQMVWICYALLMLWAVTSFGAETGVLLTINTVLMWATVIATVFSGANYLIKNKELFMESK